MLWLALFLVIFCGLVHGEKVCVEVYPHLSCGLSYTDAASCETAGCCWDDTPGAINSCFAPKIYGYTYSETSSQPGIVQGQLELTNPSGMLGPDFTQLDITITQETVSRTHIKIVPPGNNRWEVPETLLPRPGGVYTENDALTSTIISTARNDPNNPMEIYISRQNEGVPTGELIFIFSKMLVYQDQYIQCVLASPSGVVASYGFGESTRTSQHLTVNSTYAMWNTDYLAANFDGSLYGTHPFFIQVMPSGKAHGVMFMNSNAQQAFIAESDSMGQSIGMQTTGGVLDMYIFAGPTPADVVKQFQEVVGKPAMVPMWSLGFHNCEYGYPSVAYVTEVVANYSAANIPLETQWMDIDYMDAYLDFTVDPVSFSEEDMTIFINTLHANNQHFIPIVDPGIYVRDDTYDAYTSGLEQNVFVMDMTGEKPYLGQVWPGPTYFPDWFADNATSWWSGQLNAFHNLVAYDGLWIDMNEVSNFCNPDGRSQQCVMNASAACDSTECCLICTTIDEENQYDFPPFVPHVSEGSLGGKTLSMNSYHAGNILEYNAHSLYGIMEAIATKQALENTRQTRAFQVSRSTFLGSGVHTAHWTGDNNASWADLSASIITMNNLALFGISVTGADICGFLGNTNDELCSRWIEVGAFSPFSRDHNGLGQIPQELYRWDNVAEASRTVLGLRYRLLPHLYTLLYNAHAEGDTVLNAMWMHFPQDQNAFFTDAQYMWNDGILFTPVVTQGAESVTGYFPGGIWYSLFDDSVIDTSRTGGDFFSLDTPLVKTNVHVRGGTILPMQQSAMTVAASSNTPYTLLAALATDGSASGSLFMDDGEQIELSVYLKMTYEADTRVVNDDDEISGSLTSKVAAATDPAYTTTRYIESIQIVGFLQNQNVTEDFEIDECDAVAYVIGRELEVTGTAAVSSNTLEITFTQDQMLSVMSEFTLVWTCELDKIVDDDTKKNSNDDESGWDAIPEYGQALIIIVIILAVAGVAAGGFLYVRAKQKTSKRPESEPLLDIT